MARALEWGSRGQRFKSALPDQLEKETKRWLILDQKEEGVLVLQAAL